MVRVHFRDEERCLGAYTFIAVALYRSGKFRHGSACIPDFGIGSAPAWVHLAVENHGTSSSVKYLVAGMTWLDHVDIYVVQDGKLLGERMARQDPLTGLYNRRAFMELAGMSWSAASRGNRPLVLIMMDIEHAKTYAEKLRLAIAELRIPAGTSHITLTASFGVSMCSTDMKLEDMIHLSDALLYRAKSEGRDRVCA